MTYRRDCSIRDAYEEQFSQREVTFKRVVSVEKRHSLGRPEQDYDQDYDYDAQRCSGSRSYHDQGVKEYRGKKTHPGVDRGGYYSESVHFSSGCRKPSPPLKDSYHYYRGSRDDGPIGRQVELRSGGRAGSLPSNRDHGLGSPLRSMSAGLADRGDNKQNHESMYRGENHDRFRRRDPYTAVQDRSRSPVRREAQPHVPGRSGSSTSSRSYSPDRDKGYSYQQIQQRRYEEAYSQNREHGQTRELDKPRVPNHNTSLNEMQFKVEPPASVAEPGQGARVGSEPGHTPEEGFQTRRSREIATKALEIEKLYRQDCQTIGTVVKMLVAKEPSLDQLLQDPLRQNLMEIKERCLEDLRHFIKELDQVSQQPEPSCT